MPHGLPIGVGRHPPLLRELSRRWLGLEPPPSRMKTDLAAPACPGYSRFGGFHHNLHRQRGVHLWPTATQRGDCGGPRDLRPDELGFTVVGLGTYKGVKTGPAEVRAACQADRGLGKP